MKLIDVISIFIAVSCVENTIYIFNTKDIASIEFNDCIHHQNLLYCRRPGEPIILQRDDDIKQCYHNGIVHSFDRLLSNNINASIILHQWRSSIEKVEQYSRYLRRSTESNGYLCECTDPQSFGKNCEYRLPVGTTFYETFTWELRMRKDHEWKVQMHGDIVCYTTLNCNYGLLCLDWRDICDGVQQCMLGLDEENCDKLEFNECEDDEYRCMNGMCIPQEYFLDGEFDCLDWSDEIQYYDDAKCNFEGASSICDDRICLLNEWSCSDGQCIPRRLGFIEQIPPELCSSRRDQYYMCETHATDRFWTLSNGRCILVDKYDELNLENISNDSTCQFLLKCGFYQGSKKHCPCGDYFLCFASLGNPCSLEPIQYPTGRIVSPYLTFLYDRRFPWLAFKKVPDLVQINGTIKCRGFLKNIILQDSFAFFPTLRQLEYVLCRLTGVGSVIVNNGYDQHCNRQSKTFNNRSYYFIDTCKSSKECISAYRIKDGFPNCADEMDEAQNPDFLDICSNSHRYRFRCSPEESTCLSVTALGNSKENCKNKFDELWMGTSRKLSELSCNRELKEDCDSLRQYIESSWTSNDIDQSTSQLRIPFRRYCDTFWNLASKEDENSSKCQMWWTCLEDQWQCRTGQCIDKAWVLDGEWDCPDASDEEGVFDLYKTNQNIKVIQLDELNKRFDALYNIRPFTTICNMSIEFPCLRVDVSDPIPNLITERPCIRIDQIGDGRVDCYGGIDERNTLEYCGQTKMLGYHFKCLSSNDCPEYSCICNHLGKCPNIADTGFWCEHLYSKSLSSDCYKDSTDFECFNGTCARNSHCNQVVDCSFGEDEYMCDYQSKSEQRFVPYRQKKEFIVKNTQHKLQLQRFPSDTNVIKPTTDVVITRTHTPSTFPNLDSSLIPYWCNRGVGVQTYNDSTICFCPPQYYGDKCQFHSDRITVLLHLNLSKSNYITKNDLTIVIKLLVLFMFDNKTLSTHKFHIRPVVEMVVYNKKMIHFVYSRSFASRKHKNDISIRIEGYELNLDEKPRIIAVWQYPIHFDNLPVFRLAKVLRFNQLNTEENPCSSKSCNQNQECQPMLNKQSKYICHCRSNWTGENCSIKDHLCMDGYCSFKALCRSNNQHISRGNELPYCVCPLNHFGERCDLKYNQCLSSPCQNGGSCFPTSNLGQVICFCTDYYYGEKCELMKPKIQLYINETINHAGAIVQCFKINYFSFDLILVHQQAFKNLPNLFEYQHDGNTVPEIIIAKLYSSHIDTEGQIFLFSLHINVTLIYGTTQVIEKNECVDVNTLIFNETIDNHFHQSNTDKSAIMYHYLCQIHSTLMCFHTKSYLCICTDNHSRVECFGYNQNVDHCSHCLVGGQCLKGDRLELNSFICICPPCHSGSTCQFNSNSFSFILDQLFFTDLISNKKQIIFYLLIIGPFLLFCIALLSNLFSFTTFRRRKCKRNGTGQYLFCMSIINQINLGFLVARLIHLSITMMNIRSHSIMDQIFCKIFSYVLTCCSRIVYWLASLVAIERVYTTMFLSGKWFKQPYIAQRLVGLTSFLVLLSSADELIFIKSFSYTNDGNNVMCAMDFPIYHRSLWIVAHQIISIVHSILPLVINIFCTITIICVITKTKMNIREFNNDSVTEIDANTNTPQFTKQQKNLLINENQKNKNKNEPRDRLNLLFNVLGENKEMIARPAMTLVPSIFSLFSLPLFIVLFSLGCKNLEDHPLRYLLITSYFLSFIPQTMTFFLYVYPSSLYWTEWCSTTIGSWISTRSQQQQLETKISPSAAQNKRKAKD